MEMRPDTLDERKLRGLLAERGEMLESLVVAIDGTDEDPRWFSRFLIQFLTGLDMSEQEANSHYRALLAHRAEMGRLLGREPGVRVAALDYFHHVARALKNPRIVENALFEELVARTRRDPKTDCLNERAFRDAVRAELARAARYKTQLSLVMIDIDDFRAVNERHGHPAADVLLVAFAETLRGNVRVEDQVARYGGDEFALLLPQTGRIGGRALAERVRHRLLERFPAGSPEALSFSAGIATYPHDAADYEGLVRGADAALYRSKALGKNRVHDYLEEQHLAAEARDKRRHPRYRVAEGAVADLAADQTPLGLQSRIVNISAGGVLLECRYQLPADLVRRALELRVTRIGAREVPPLSIAGHAVRVDEETASLKFLLAIEFSEQIDASTWADLESRIELKAV